MTGLEKILKAIEDEAKAGADAVIADAKREAEEILAAAKSEAEKKCVQITEKSEADIKAVINRAESAAALQEKKTILEAKQQIISNIITSARNKLAKLPDSEYTDIILQMVKKYAHNKAGSILFSANDKNRLPKDFDARLKQVLADKTSASLTVSDETANLDGGFLLVYGDIEENCSFDALFSAAKENLQDKVNSLLFE
jgi:V/A-type H+/Na+-transporting ATPase subunit E